MNYSHIQTQEANVNNSSTAEDPGNELPSISRKSAQEEIEEQLAYPLRRSTTPKSANHPLTFAEATMSTRRGRRRSSTKSINEADATLSGPMSLGSLGPFRYTMKKKKKKKGGKWAPLDLSATDSTSEKGNYAFSEEGSRAASPFPNTANFSILQRSAPQPNPENIQVSTNTPRRDTGLNFPDFTPGRDIGLDFHDTELSARSEAEDPEAVKENFDAAMARLASSTKVAGGDAFDSLEWDPELPSATAPDASPEPVTINPQPVYTTVGSVVNPSLQPQFVAPNRIQREGSLRRPLMPMSARQYEAFSPRGPPPSLTIANSMQYTQQLMKSSARFPYSPPPRSARSSISARSFQQPGADMESELMRRLTEMVGMVPSQSPLSPTSIAFSDRDNLAVKSCEEEHSRRREEDTLSQTSSMPSSLQGNGTMLSMQTLSNYNNPVQRAARNRHSEFSTVRFPDIEDPKETLTRIENEYRARKLSLEGMLRQKNEAEEKNEVQAGSVLGRQPPPGLSTITQANPLYGAGSLPSSQSTLRPGVPQPLTAGPPGQRSSHHVAKKLVAGRQNLRPLDTRGTSHLSAFGHPTPISPWSAQPSDVSVPASHNPYDINFEDYTKIIDTLPIDEVQAYYPTKLPNGMTGQYRPLSYAVQQQMDAASNEPLSEQEQRLARADDLERSFYSGQRSYGMTVDDHIKALQVKESYQAQDFGSIGSHLGDNTRPNIEKKPLSKENIATMSTAQAAKPLIDAAFGTILAYADNKSSSRRLLSQFSKSPAWMIDDTEEGRKSFLGGGLVSGNAVDELTPASYGTGHWLP